MFILELWLKPLSEAHINGKHLNSINFPSVNGSKLFFFIEEDKNRSKVFMSQVAYTYQNLTWFSSHEITK